MQTDPEWVRNRLGEKLTIEQQLRRPISLHFKEVPLNQAVKDLSLLTGVKIVLDLPDLEAAKIHLDVPLSINVENIDMKSALRLLLNRLRLAYVIENQTIKITTPEKAHPLFQRAYSVADLVEPVPLFEGQKSRKPNDAVLVECIQSCAATSSWEANGGKGTIQYFPKDRSLVITQHVEAHEEVALLLATLRKLQELTVSAEVRFIQASTDVARQWRGTMAQDGTRIVSFRELKAVDSAEPRFLMRSGAPGLIEEDESELRTFVALDNARAEQLLKLAQGDRSSSIIQAPKLSVFNGQRIPFECLRKESVIVEFKTRGTEGKEEGVSTPVRDVIVGGWRCKLQPVVSPDRRFVRLSLDVQHFTRDNASSVELSTKATKTFNVSDGATLLWDLGETAERQHLFVLVTPRIHAREEEEQIFLGEIRR
jgi:hypothetical protein